MWSNLTSFFTYKIGCIFTMPHSRCNPATMIEPETTLEQQDISLIILKDFLTIISIKIISYNII